MAPVSSGLALDETAHRLVRGRRVVEHQIRRVQRQIVASKRPRNVSVTAEARSASGDGAR